ncbi:alpha/beta fold hydrolase [Colwellia hornerae]|nr:alpha/beta fold hydrolase [Colwellia hornerae]
MTIHNPLKGAYISGQGTPIVLLHSSLSSARQWQPLVKLLEPHYLVINIDMLSYGNAEKVADELHYNFDVEINRIKKIINSVAQHQSFHLVGHSCGGAIALKLAIEDPEKILSLSLYEPVAFHLLEQNSGARVLAENFANQVNIDDRYKGAEIFTDFWNQAGFFAALPQKIQDIMARDMPKVSLDFKGLISEKYTLSDLSRLTCKVLMMTGEQSPELSRSLANQIKASLPNVEHQHFPTGHMGPVTHSGLIHPAIARFIAH